MARRQHETTTVHEVASKRCSALLAVCNSNSKLALFYLHLEPDEWHRFFLDAGLLFWSSGGPPDPDNDLLEGDRYLDLGDSLQMVGHRITCVCMEDGVLKITMDNRSKLVLKEDGEGASILEGETRGEDKVV